MFGLEIEPKFIWMALGILLMILEMSIIPGIGFLFAGLGAVTTFLLLEFSVINIDWVSNIAVFLGASVIWGIILWKPLKKALNSSKDTYSHMVGDSCKVIGVDLVKGEVGKVSWSGTVMKAKIDNKEHAKTITVGSIAEIVSVKGNTLYIKQKNR